MSPNGNGNRGGRNGKDAKSSDSSVCCFRFRGAKRLPRNFTLPRWIIFSCFINSEICFKFRKWDSKESHAEECLQIPDDHAPPQHENALFFIIIIPIWDRAPNSYLSKWNKSLCCIMRLARMPGSHSHHSFRFIISILVESLFNVKHHDTVFLKW